MHADRVADGDVEHRLDERNDRDPGELARDQRDPADGCQREPVQEPGLDVAGQVGARVHRREERALHERHGERERDEASVGSRDHRRGLEAAGVHGEQAEKITGATTLAGWRPAHD